jgi:hypothetical protein
VGAQLFPEAPTQFGAIVIAGDETLEDAYAVAGRCIAEWGVFLQGHGLRVP